MTLQNLQALLTKNLITKSQFDKLEPIASGKVVSVYYELRTMLYLGVLLFTGGLGILIYKNIGEIGHLISIILLCVATLACFIYVFLRAVPFTTEKVKAPTPYYDYIVLLGSLLFISVQGYLQFQYQLLDENLGWSTLISACFFFFVAYRFDHLGILSLAITALASFWSLSVSPQKWYSGDFFETADLHITALYFGAALCAAAMALNWKGIKRHFTFTYLNFGLLLFLAGAIVGLFDSDNYGVYLLLIYAGSGFAVYYAHKEKSFLFLLYAFICAYIGTTYFLVDTIFDEIPELIFYYFIASCGGFIYFIITFRNYFSRKV